MVVTLFEDTSFRSPTKDVFTSKKVSDYLLNILFANLLITFRHDSYAKSMMCTSFFNMVDFFQIFFVSCNTEILIESNFWLKIYVSYILKGVHTYKMIFSNPVIHMMSVKNYGNGRLYEFLTLLTSTVSHYQRPENQRKFLKT